MSEINLTAEEIINIFHSRLLSAVDDLASGAHAFGAQPLAEFMEGALATAEHILRIIREWNDAIEQNEKESPNAE